MTTSPHAELKRLAEAATPGPWEARWRLGRETTVVGRQRFPICDTATAPHGQANVRRENANAAFIAAANPQAILSLIEENERMREWGERVIAWAEAQAARHEASAQDRRFPSLSDAYAHDAANLRKIAMEARQALRSQQKREGL